MEAFAAAPEIDAVIVVAAPDRVAELRTAEWLRAVGAEVVAGGSRRQDSMAAGVRAAASDVVLVHDAARPLVSGELIARVAEAAARHGAAIPTIPVVDALKQVDAGGIITGATERSGLFRAQTPQAARRR